jgi:hypothetical protein
MASAFKDATLSISKGKDMARAIEIVGVRRGVNERTYRGGPIVGRYSSGRAMSVVDRNREGRALGLGVRHHHEGQLELVGALTL